MLQYLFLIKGKQIKVRVKKQSASPESSQIDIIGMQRKKHKFINFNLRIQKRFKEKLLKILKSYKNLQKSVSKINKYNLNNFKSNLKSLKGLFKSFKDTSERKVKPKDFNENLNENQFKTK